jgi:predicted RNase H-like HicB family nuclease
LKEIDDAIEEFLDDLQEEEEEEPVSSLPKLS